MWLVETNSYLTARVYYRVYIFELQHLVIGWSACIWRESYNNPWHDGIWRDLETNRRLAGFACIEILCTRSNIESLRRRCNTQPISSTPYIRAKIPLHKMQTYGFVQLGRIFEENLIESCLVASYIITPREKEASTCCIAVKAPA